METQVRAAGTTNVIFGVASLLFVPTFVSYLGGFAELYDVGEIGLMIVGSAVLHLLVAVPCMVLGWYVTQYREWARTSLIVVSGLNLINFPFGSIIGGFTLWTLLAPEAEPLFTDPPPGYGSRRVPAKTKAAERSKPDPVEKVKRPMLRSSNADLGPN